MPTAAGIIDGPLAIGTVGVDIDAMAVVGGVSIDASIGLSDALRCGGRFTGAAAIVGCDCWPPPRALAIC